MSEFEIHPQLLADCHRLRELSLSTLLLNRNAAVPWFILVPHVEQTELCDLAPRDRAALDTEIDAVCALLRREFPEVTKLNVAALGNQVPQLHVHVIGRHAGDPCWPKPVWGSLQEERAWSGVDLERLAGAARAAPAAGQPGTCP